MTLQRQLLQRLAATASAAGSGAPLPADADAISDALAAISPPPAPWPDELVGRPCAVPPILWHGTGLADCCARYRVGSSDDEALRARLVYHTRRIAHLIDPSDPRFRPSVSIVIPVWNRARVVRQAIDSCLAQDWPVEIVVVDDGSTDRLHEVLARVSGRIRLLRQENCGVSVARHAGIRAATGDFVHFLDSDDFLLPQCVARKLAAFSAIPDAELCYGGVINYDPDAVRRELIAYEHPDGGPLCPTTSLMAAVARRMPFLPSVVMMPRWLLLETRAFQEGLRRGEDVRLWFSLGLRGTKVIGLAEELTLRRNDARTLGRVPREPTCSLEIAILMNLCDLLAAPQAWHFAFQCLNLIRTAGLWEQINLGTSATLIEWRARAVHAIGDLGEQPSPGGYSVLPLLVLLLAGLRTLDDEPAAADHDFAFHRDLEAAAHRAARRAAALTDSDAVFWLTAERTAGFDSTVAARLAELAGEWEAAGSTHMLPAVRMLLNLASPAFDPADFRPPTLAAALSRRIVATFPHVPQTRTGHGSIVPPAVLRLLPGGQEGVRKRALGLINRLLAAPTSRTAIALGREPRTWDLLDAACSSQAKAHLGALHEALDGWSAAPGRQGVLEARVRLHARALARSLGSSERASRPSAALVVPVAGANRELPETVASCLVQDHDRIETLVVGEGIEILPQDLAARVRSVPMNRPGIAAARNVGLAHSAADFVMFVDPGTVLGPACISAHLAALEATPGSELAVALPDGWPPEIGLVRLLVNGRMAAGQWLAPRWLLLETGPVDRWFGTRDLDRYAFRLAMRRPRLARVDELHMPRIPQRDDSDSTDRTAVAMLALADLLESPELWRHCAAVAAEFHWPHSRPPACSRDRILLDLVEERLRDAVRTAVVRHGTGNATPPQLQAAIAAILQALDSGDIRAAHEASALRPV